MGHYISKSYCNIVPPQTLITKMTTMKRLLELIVFFLFFSLSSNSQTQTICSDTPVPAGWVTLAFGQPCKTVGGITYYNVTIQRIDNLPTGAFLRTCGDNNLPIGWVTTDSYGVCSVVGGIERFDHRIQNIGDMLPGTTINICDVTPPPAGWIVTAVGNSCESRNFGGIVYHNRTIQKYQGLPAGSIIQLCSGDAIPDGWIITNIGNPCFSPYIGISYSTTTIEKIDGLPSGSVRQLCGLGPLPEGWIVTKVEGSCRTIVRIQGLPPGSKLVICGTPPTPPGWITSDWGDVCQTVGTTFNFARTITKIQNLPVGTTLAICSNDPVPQCWNLISTGSMCKTINQVTYFTRTIQKVSTNAVCDPPDNFGRCCIVHSDGTSDCKITSSESACRMSSGASDIAYSFVLGSDCQKDPCPVSSPFNLSTLTAIYNDKMNSVQLSWQIEAGNKTEGFYIARSKSGQKFKTIGVQKNNSDSGITKFQFTDTYPELINQYQLHWFSEGKLYRSQVISAIAMQGEKLLLVPNPASNRVKVLLKNMQLYNTEVSVFDLSGRKILSQRLSQGQAELNLSALSKGTFIIRVNQNGKTYTEKLIKN